MVRSEELMKSTPDLFKVRDTFYVELSTELLVQPGFWTFTCYWTLTRHWLTHMFIDWAAAGGWLQPIDHSCRLAWKNIRLLRRMHILHASVCAHPVSLNTEKACKRSRRAETQGNVTWRLLPSVSRQYLDWTATQTCPQRSFLISM